MSFDKLKKNIINNKNILVTGGTGSFGSVFVEYLLENYKPRKVMVFSRDEQKQFLMEKKLQKYQKIDFIKLVKSMKIIILYIFAKNLNSQNL